MKLGILGISFKTGNLGVSALGESTIQSFLQGHPGAEIYLLACGMEQDRQRVWIEGKEIVLKTYTIRFSKNILKPDHFFRLFLVLIWLRLFSGRQKRAVVERDGTLKALWESDFVADITGGDSFSDIYGFKRFFIGFCRKWLVLLAGKKLILLPQTYGPFRGKLSRRMARYLLGRCDRICSRDRQGVDYLKTILPAGEFDQKVRLCPDVAFVMKAQTPDPESTEWLGKVHDEGGILIGLNFSALLYHGGYNRRNMFGLKVSYPEFALRLVQRLLENPTHSIVLIDHVCPGEGHLEHDPDVSCKVIGQLSETLRDRVYHPTGAFSQGQVKYLIGLCDFFAGSRMHACIAALSQCVPVAGLAYSNKFRGVFQTVQMKKTVVDLRSCSNDEAIEMVETLLKDRNILKEELQQCIPAVQKQVLSLFYELI